MFAPYFVVAAALLFSGMSAIVWISTVSHLDPPEVQKRQEVEVKRSAA